MVPCALNPSTQQADLCEFEAYLVYMEGVEASHDFHQYLQQTMLCGFLPDTYQTCNRFDIPPFCFYPPTCLWCLAQTRFSLRKDTSDPGSSCSRLKAPSVSPNLPLLSSLFNMYLPSVDQSNLETPAKTQGVAATLKIQLHS